MHRYGLNITYNGSRFHGWQKIKNSVNVHSIQGVVEKQLCEVTGYNGCQVYASGRTDTGVHALHQWVHTDQLYQNKDSQVRSVLEGWKKFCRLQRDTASKHTRFLRRREIASNSHKVGKRSRHDEAVVDTNLIRQACLYATDPSLPTLAAVRRLPVPPAPCFTAASAAIDVVRDTSKHKYTLNYGRLCIFGIPGIHSVHCEQYKDSKDRKESKEKCIDFTPCTCNTTANNNNNSNILEILENTLFIPNKHVFLPAIRTLPSEKVFLRMLNDCAAKHGYDLDLKITHAVRLPQFHARFRAVKRRYVYRVLISKEADLFESGRVWSIFADKVNFSLDRAAAAAEALTGRHDYTSFRSQQCQAKSPVRTVESITLAWEPSFRERLSGIPLGTPFGTSARGLGLEAEHTANNYMYTSLFGYRGKLGVDFLKEGPTQPVTEVRATEYGLQASEAEVVNKFLRKQNLQLQPVRIPSLPAQTPQLLSSQCTEGSILTVSLQSRSFLHSQVRILVGAIVAAGFGDYKVDEIPDFLALKSRMMNPVQTAPPEGQFQSNVEYPSGKDKELYEDVFQQETDLLECYKDQCRLHGNHNKVV